MNTATLNLAWADAFVAALASAGVRHVACGPGARSAPLAAAFLRRPEIECHVVNDERAAAYFALGIGKATGRPAAVLCTSGTAAANLLPAIMEANLAAVPLLALTADRPPEAHGWGANQTVDQTKLYGDQMRAFHALPPPDAALLDTTYLRTLAARLLAECSAPLPGPVHANLPFREPLLPETLPAPPALPAGIASASPTSTVDADGIAALAGRIAGRPGVIVCGEGPYPPIFAPAIAALAERLAAPILAEPLSNLRSGIHDKSRVLAHAAHFLRADNLHAPDWVLRCGTFPVSRVLERWLAGLDSAEHILVAPPGRWPDPLWRSDTVAHGNPLECIDALATLCRRPASPEFCAAWQQAEQTAVQKIAAQCETTALFEGSVARRLLDALPADGQVFVGNSLAIRAVDVFCGTTAKPLTLHGNRGASGIDGNLATAAGIAAATEKPLGLLIGDQTLLHDCGSLALLAGRDAVVVAMDNGGGRIFDHLPFAAALPPELLARGWTAPPQADFAALAAAFGLRHAAASDAAALRQVLHAAFTSGGTWLVRAVIDPDASRTQFAR